MTAAIPLHPTAWDKTVNCICVLLCEQTFCLPLKEKCSIVLQTVIFLSSGCPLFCQHDWEDSTVQCKCSGKCAEVRCETLKPNTAVQSLSIKAHTNIFLSVSNASQPGFSSEPKGGRYSCLTKFQLDCTPKPIQLLQIYTDKSPEFTQQRDKEGNT